MGSPGKGLAEARDGKSRWGHLWRAHAHPVDVQDRVRLRGYMADLPVAGHQRRKSMGDGKGGEDGGPSRTRNKNTKFKKIHKTIKQHIEYK